MDWSGRFRLEKQPSRNRLVADIEPLWGRVGMEAVILKGDAVLGTGIVQHLDPPMGVAFGPFTPSGRFSAYLHANTIDGEYVGDKAADFVAVLDGAPVQTASIALEDWSRSLGEHHFTIWFRDSKEYEPLFRNHPDYKAYYPEKR